MLIPLIVSLLAVSEVSSTADAVQPPTPRWGVHLSLAAPSLIGASFDLPSSGVGGTGIGMLGGLGAIPGLTTGARPLFANALTLERAFGVHWSGVTSVSFGYTASAFRSVSGTGMIGARWYLTRSFQGLFAGPELLFQITSMDLGLGPLAELRSYAAGLRGRVGWSQLFGEHVVVSASAGVGANVAWLSSPAQQQSLQVGLDVALAAGLVF